MKKRFISILLSLSLVTLPCTALTVGAAGTDTVTKKTVPAYLYGMDKQTEFECVFTQELPEVVYIAPEDYLNHIYTTTNVQTKNADGTYSVTSENGTMVVDPNADTIYYENFEGFTLYHINMEGTSTDSDYTQTLPPEQRGDIAPLTLNLADYGIDVIEYEGKVYLPLPTLNDIHALTYNSAEYIDGNIYFTHSMDYASGSSYYDRSSLFNTDERTPAMADFTYREMCFLMDYF